MFPADTRRLLETRRLFAPELSVPWRINETGVYSKEAFIQGYTAPTLAQSHSLGLVKSFAIFDI